jgi:hypothetical protein
VHRNLKAKILISSTAGDDFSTRTAVLVFIKAAMATNKSAAVGTENMAGRYMHEQY